MATTICICKLSRNGETCLVFLHWELAKRLILLPTLRFQEFSWKKFRSNENRKPNGSLSGMMWPQSCLDASPWSTVTQMMTLSLTTMTGPTESHKAGQQVDSQGTVWQCVRSVCDLCTHIVVLPCSFSNFCINSVLLLLHILLDLLSIYCVILKCH